VWARAAWAAALVCIVAYLVVAGLIGSDDDAGHLRRAGSKQIVQRAAAAGEGVSMAETGKPTTAVAIFVVDDTPDVRELQEAAIVLTHRPSVLTTLAHTVTRLNDALYAPVVGWDREGLQSFETLDGESHLDVDGHVFGRQPSNVLHVYVPHRFIAADKLIDARRNDGNVGAEFKLRGIFGLFDLALSAE
jgi:hypothetical protein